jgi:hypothetical protein
MAIMSIRLDAAAKGFMVGVFALGISIAGSLVYTNWWENAGCPANFSDCGTAGMEGFAILIEEAVAGFFLLVALGPLLAWAVRLPRPGSYVLPAVLSVIIDVPVACAWRYVPWEFLFVAPFVAYPLMAVWNSDRRTST